jgi:peptidoglycan/LPS O-acetylase OafA/YrhL
LKIINKQSILVFQREQNLKKRIKTIDFIKGIAILMIILVHYNQKYTNNIGLFTYFQMGCSIFFVASGWGITQVLKKYDRINKKNIFLFYKSRIKTIAPGWYFAILILYLINIFFNLLNINIDIGNNRNMGDIICNLFFVHGVVPSACNTVVPGGVVYRNNNYSLFTFSFYI